MSAAIQINNRRVGAGQPAYVVAEISANHHQEFDQAVQLVRAAQEAGADAVKLQTYTPDTLTLRSDDDAFRIQGGTLWDGRTLYDLYAEAFTPWDWIPRLQAVAANLGIALFSTAYDPSSVDFLEQLGVPVHKIASFELVDIPLIEKMGRTRKPLIISTGMATFAEIEAAVQTARAAGSTGIALLKCTSAYPAPPEEMNLRTIPHLAEAFNLPVGLSDHTLGIAVPAAAVVLGACIIEKHMTLSRCLPGPDSPFSLEPAEFKAMVEAVRTVEQSLGEVRYGTSVHENRSRTHRRSLYIVKPVKAGEPFTRHNVRSVRPANGLPPKCLNQVLSRTAAIDIASGTPLEWRHVG
ncbi:MAG TPA: pseudaminic acid synthase [Terriglobia bacterium]|nr:pseudaminic acid synthase [Terriglobia bacterium]